MPKTSNEKSGTCCGRGRCLRDGSGITLTIMFCFVTLSMQATSQITITNRKLLTNQEKTSLEAAATTLIETTWPKGIQGLMEQCTHTRIIEPLSSLSSTGKCNFTVQECKFLQKTKTLQPNKTVYLPLLALPNTLEIKTWNTLKPLESLVDIYFYCHTSGLLGFSTPGIQSIRLTMKELLCAQLTASFSSLMLLYRGYTNICSDDININFVVSPLIPAISITQLLKPTTPPKCSLFNDKAIIHILLPLKEDDPTKTVSTPNNNLPNNANPKSQRIKKRCTGSNQSHVLWLVNCCGPRPRKTSP